MLYSLVTIFGAVPMLLSLREPKWPEEPEELSTYLRPEDREWIDWNLALTKETW